MRFARRRSSLYRVCSCLVIASTASAVQACEPVGAPRQATVVELPRADTVPSSAGPDTLPPASTSDTLSSDSASTSIPAQLAELPRETVAIAYPSATRAVRVPDGADLQAAIDAAQPGDELLLARGATYYGNFTLPDKGTSSQWIVIRSDSVVTLPSMRMTPSAAASNQLARIVSTSDLNESLITTAPGAHHYRFTLVEMGVTSAVTSLGAIIQFGGSDFSQTAANTAHHLIIDRAYVHGTPTTSVSRCLALNSAQTAVIDSWFADCHGNAGDSQAIAGWNGPGPFLIENNHLEGGHEVIAFGGGSFTQADGSPSDITVRGNHITRPLAWRRTGAPGFYRPGEWQVKNLIETKHVHRMLIEGNVLENNWNDAQAGFAFVIKSENQVGDTPWTQSSDITIRYNKIRNTGNVISLAAGPQYSTRLPAARIVISDNLVEHVNFAPFSGDGHTLQLLGELTDIVMMHNTVTSANGNSSAVVLGQLPVVQRLVLHSNVLQHGAYGIKGGGTSEGTPSLTTYAPGSLVTHNLFVGGGEPADYPVNNYFSAGMSEVGFRDVAAEDYRLDASRYRQRGRDGRDIGADIDRVELETRKAVVAP
ncbi:MAG: hypothetical protein ABIP93_16805 [Gemmatimonadaceae bacterium]